MCIHDLRFRGGSPQTDARRTHCFTWTTRFVLSGLFLLMLHVAAKTQAADAVVDKAQSWVSFRNSLANQGLAAAPLPENLELLWEHETPDGSASTPVIADGKTYVGTLSGDIHCFDLRTGDLHWTYKSVEMVAKNDIPPGFNAPLALNDTTVFGGDDFGTFHAVDRATGKKKWTFETSAEIVGGAQIVGDAVIFGSHDGHLYSFDAETGEQNWSAETHGPVNATPTIVDGKTFTTGCDQPILRVFDISNGQNSQEMPLNSLLIASAGARDGKLYFGTDGGSVFELDTKKSNQGWTFSIPNREQQINSSPAVTEDFVIIGSRDKSVHCIHRQTGELKWSFPTRGRVDSSPVVAGDVVYFGSADRNIYGVSISTGEEVWSYNARQSVTGSPAIADGCLVICTDTSNGKILCFGKK